MRSPALTVKALESLGRRCRGLTHLMQQGAYALLALPTDCSPVFPHLQQISVGGTEVEPHSERDHEIVSRTICTLAHNAPQLKEFRVMDESPLKEPLNNAWRSRHTGLGPAAG
jgi:hypothetical protein